MSVSFSPFRVAACAALSLAACIGGKPVTAECRTTDDCDAGWICNRGTCQRICVSNGDCSDGQVCIDEVCQANPFRTCAEVEPCPVGQSCEESDGTGDARCGPMACTGVGRGTCPEAFECIAEVCVRSRQGAGATFAAGVTRGTVSSPGYRLFGVVSPPEGHAPDALTSSNYRLEPGLVR